jgi:predicted nucleic acid-binding Zn ribbon protein
MPTYVYRFVDTGETIEVQQSFTDQALTEAEHPTTGLLMPVRKVFTPVGVTFKGGGFYKTDSRAKSGSSRKSDSTTGKESTSKESTSTDSSSGSKSGDSANASSGSTSKDASKTTTTTAGAGRD